MKSEEELTDVHFNGDGTRLLCSGFSGSPTLYNISNDHQTLEKVQLADGFNPSKSTCRFAGEDDELAVASSITDSSLYIWSVPPKCDDDNRTINQPLLSLSGHKKGIESIRYCKATSMLASCDHEEVNDGIVILWAPSN